MTTEQKVRLLKDSIAELKAKKMPFNEDFQKGYEHGLNMIESSFKVFFSEELEAEPCTK